MENSTVESEVNCRFDFKLYHSLWVIVEHIHRLQLAGDSETSVSKFYLTNCTRDFYLQTLRATYEVRNK